MLHNTTLSLSRSHVHNNARISLKSIAWIVEHVAMFIVHAVNGSMRRIADLST